MAGQGAAAPTPGSRRAGRLLSSIGRKAIVALTGAALLGFVIAHLLGNLQVFLGPEALNKYAAGLKGLGPLLWVLRGGLLAVAVVHVVLALQLARESRAARPRRYAHRGRLQSTRGARSMVLTGLMILLFVGYHLAHFTLGLTQREHFGLVDAAGRHDVYSMVVLGFRSPLVSGLYVAAMALLALHLSHGVQSVFQTLGVTSPRWSATIRRAGLLLAWVVFLGNSSMPAAILAGWVGLPGGG